MNAFFKDIFNYHHRVNTKLINLFLDNPDKISERASFLLSHCLNAQHIWNSRILKTDSVGVNDLHSIEDCQTMNEKNHKNTLSILENYDLADKFEYSDSKGNPYVNNVQEMLFQIANHFSHHRGQIMSELRQNGVEPFISDYIYYKR